MAQLKRHADSGISRVDIRFHVHLNVAQLKRVCDIASAPKTIRFPRSSERGSIEAWFGVGVLVALRETVSTFI